MGIIHHIQDIAIYRVHIRVIIVIFSVLLLTCKSRDIAPDQAASSGVVLTVLGVAQDAGYPQIGCTKTCCLAFQDSGTRGATVASIGIFDQQSQQSWVIDATPDFPAQVKALQAFSGTAMPDGIFLTHAHIGHYTGLMYLGREALGASGLPVFAMPKMQTFLELNGPWSQLVALGNIELKPLTSDSAVRLSAALQITPFVVPHRDEFSETVGFFIQGPSKTALYIPDIDKWEKWQSDISTLISKVDYALLDGSFYDGGELPHRDMSEIPHPFVVESMALFDQLDVQDKSKVIFTHLNHTNPLLQKESPQHQQVLQKGYQVAYEGMVLNL